MGKEVVVTGQVQGGLWEAATVSFLNQVVITIIVVVVIIIHLALQLCYVASVLFYNKKDFLKATVP